MKRCNSCGRNTKRFAEFPCSTCGDKIVRCHFCRENLNQYKCQCGFEGP